MYKHIHIYIHIYIHINTQCRVTHNMIGWQQFSCSITIKSLLQKIPTKILLFRGRTLVI